MRLALRALGIFLFVATSLLAAEHEPASVAGPEGFHPLPAYLKYNGFLGVHVLDISAISIGGQVGFPILRGLFFVGPEVDYSLFTEGNLLSLLGTVWYEKHLRSARGLALHVGVAAGVGFAQGYSGLSFFNGVAAVDFGIAQEIDQDVFLRGQMKPGIVGGFFSFMMTLSLQFVLR